jgi:hypothetical protein
MPYIQPGSGSELDTLNEEAALDEAPTSLPAPAPAETPAEAPAPAEQAPQESETKKRFSWF